MNSEAEINGLQVAKYDEVDEGGEMQHGKVEPRCQQVEPYRTGGARWAKGGRRVKVAGLLILG